MCVEVKYLSMNVIVDYDVSCQKNECCKERMYCLLKMELLNDVFWTKT